MNLFDNLVTEALSNQPQLSTLRLVVEKELLHHDILRILSQNNFLTHLTFIGGTALRVCYGGIRLSEDLDFTGGSEFSRKSLSSMSHTLTHSLNEKYGLKVTVSEPVKNTKNVDTWKIKVETRPKKKHLPNQRINIDICAVRSYEKKPMMLLNPYGVDMGTSGLIIQTQSKEEIYTDKLLAFALRPNRIKYRDLWDIVWLHRQGLVPNFDLIPHKLQDRKLSEKHFTTLYNQRLDILSSDSDVMTQFKKEMARFLPLEETNNPIAQEAFWPFLVSLMRELGGKLSPHI